MPGLGSWLTRDRIYTVTDSNDPLFNEVHTIYGPPLLAPDWGPSGPSAYQGGMGIPAGWAAALMRAEQTARFPFHLYRQRPVGPAERLNTPPFLTQPCPPWTKMSTLTQLGLDYVWHGNGIGIVARNADATPSTVLPVRADLVTVGRSPRTGALLYDVAGKIYLQDEILHIKGPSAPGELRGVGVLEAHFNGLRGSQDLNRQANNHVHGVPTGVIEATSPDTGRAELTSAKETWLKAQRTRTIAALAPGTKFTPISWNPEQLQLVEAQKFDLVKWALIFRIPAYWLNGESAGFTYSSADWEGRNLLKYTAVGSDLQATEEALSLLYPRGQYVKGNADAVLRGSTKERYDAHEVGIRAGFLLKSEARNFEDLPEVDGIDDPPAPPPALEPPPTDDAADPASDEPTD